MKFSLGKPKPLIQLMTSVIIYVAESISFFARKVRKKNVNIVVVRIFSWAVHGVDMQ